LKISTIRNFEKRITSLRNQLHGVEDAYKFQRQEIQSTMRRFSRELLATLGLPVELQYVQLFDTSRDKNLRILNEQELVFQTENYTIFAERFFWCSWLPTLIALPISLDAHNFYCLPEDVLEVDWYYFADGTTSELLPSVSIRNDILHEILLKKITMRETI